MCKESNEDDTKETLQNKQTKGTHRSSVGVLVRVHMLQVCVHVKHVVVLVALRIRVVMSVVVNVPKIDFYLYLNSLSIIHTAKTGLLRCCLYTIFHQFIRFPLLRRPSLITVPF